MFLINTKSIGRAGGLGDPYTVVFMIQAGGGGAGRDGWVASIIGGGPGGGLRTSFAGGSGGGGASESDMTLYTNGVYTITVGAGGAGDVTEHPDGGDSSVAGPELVTYTSVGGGATTGSGADEPLSGRDGGCGGWGFEGGGEGTANQGYDGTSWVSGYARGGGASVTAESTSQTGANGKQVNIDGNNYYWGAGGGGAGHGSQGGAGGVGGQGGGGGGGQHPSWGPGAGGTGGINDGTAGAYTLGGTGGANTGSGGGGGGGSADNGSTGGSGIVILRIPDANYSGVHTGSPTVNTSTDASQTILTWTGDGTYTA
jgi:hypothetical protein